MAQLTVKLLITVIIIIYNESTSVLGGTLPFMIVEQYYYWGNCSWYEFRTANISPYHIYRPVHDATMNCKDNEWIVVWNAEDLGKAANNKNCTPVPASDHDNDCYRCLCAREPSIPDCVDIPGYYWGLSETNIDENKVMIGTQVFPTSYSIQMFIGQATLLSDGTVDYEEEWGKSTKYFTPGIECNELSINSRTFYLDDVILPAKYVVTGIKLVAMEKSEGPKGWKLQVKGTEYDSSFKLIKGTDQWFDYSNDSNSDVAYKRNRTEIALMTHDDSDYLYANINRYVRIEDTDFTAIRRMVGAYFRLVNTPDDFTPLQGVALSLTSSKYFDGILNINVSAHESLVHTTTTPPEIVTESTIETTTEAPTTIPVETTTEAPTTIPIETTVAPKIISRIKLRTTTTTTTTTTKAARYMMFNISTQLPPTIQPKLKRLRTHPINLSCDPTFKLHDGQEETVDLLEELFIPDEREENSGTKFFNSQLSFICALLLSIFL